MRIFFSAFLILFGTLYAEEAKPKVVVVGAGIAGLTTAYRLQQKEVETHVYEARNRVGGRIFTVKIGGKVAELGGQNIADGGNAENLRRLIDEFDIELEENRLPMNYSYFNQGTLIPGHLLNINHLDPEELKDELKAIAQRSKNMREILNELLEEDHPFYKVLSVRLAGYEGAPPEKLSPLYIETLYHMLLGGICSVHQGSGKESEIELVSIKEGNALLPEKLAEALWTPVHLNMPLASVTRAEDASYELLFQNGEKVKADILVMAVPCSVYSDIALDDVIPEEKLNDIKNIQYGTNGKILVPLFQMPLKKMSYNNDRIACYFGGKEPILTLYFTGESGKFTQETILETIEQERPTLEIGFENLCPPLNPVFAQDMDFVSYEGPVGYSWPNDPFVKGSYSYVAPGQEELLTATHEVDGEIVKTLFAPIDHTLFFAGEHATILLDVPGTMEAACESGERTARMIEKSLRATEYSRL